MMSNFMNRISPISYTNNWIGESNHQAEPSNTWFRQLVNDSMMSLKAGSPCTVFFDYQIVAVRKRCDRLGIRIAISDLNGLYVIRRL